MVTGLVWVCSDPGQGRGPERQIDKFRVSGETPSRKLGEELVHSWSKFQIVEKVRILNIEHNSNIGYINWQNLEHNSNQGYSNWKNSRR